MSASPHNTRRRAWLPIVLIGVTALACIAALAFRTSIRSRFWAWRIAHTADVREQAIYLTALCNAGESARWGISALLDDPHAEIRQLGLVTLQHVRTPWSREQLLAALSDADGDVRALAALGLATHGDDSIIPRLEEMYASDDESRAAPACLALERLGTPAAIAALTRLAARPASVTARAALTDALESIGEPGCVPALLSLLNDDRPCDVIAQSERVAAAVLNGAFASGDLPPDALPAATRALPSTMPIAATGTIAERAAAALAHITGERPGFSSDANAATRAAARAVWQDWYDATAVQSAIRKSP